MNNKEDLEWKKLEKILAVPLGIIEKYSRYLQPPVLCDSDDSDRGYHFLKPNVKHFCLLKMSKAIVSFRAAICIAKEGFHTEVATLMRVVVECCTMTNWAADIFNKNATNEHKKEVHDYVRAYFLDNMRNKSEIPKVLRISQKRIHDMHGAILDTDRTDISNDHEKKMASELMSSVYIRFSKYVHAHYPETMDLYGIKIGELSLSGSKGSVKDNESYEILSVFLETVSQAVASILVLVDRPFQEQLNDEERDWFLKKIGA
jgi:hypothetical protein